MLLLVATFSLTVASCGGDDNDESNVAPSFVKIAAGQVAASGGTIDCYINDCNSLTSVRSTVSWITAQVYDLKGRCSIQVSKNETTESRTGIVELLHGGQVVDTYSVTQMAGDSNNPGVGGDTPDSGGEFGAPTGLVLSKNGYAVTLKWNKVPGADKYWIYYSNPTAFSSGHFVTMKNTTSTSFTMDCKIAGNWAFKIQAQKGSEYSDFSNVVTTSISQSDINGGEGGGGSSNVPSKPTGLKATVRGNQVTVSWNASTGASYYRLYYVKPAPYDFESFDNIYSTSTTMTCNVSGTWTIWVVAVGSNYEASAPSAKVTFNVSSSSGGGSGGGSGSGSGDNPSKLDTPTGLTVNSRASDSYVQLQCNAVSLGYDYQLYRSTSPNSGYTKVTASVGTDKTGSIVYLTDQSPKRGTTYYKVKVAALSYLGIKDSDYSNYVKVVR